MGCQRAVHPGREVPVPAWRISQYEAYKYCNKIGSRNFTAEDAKGAEKQNLTADCHGFYTDNPLANLRSAAATAFWKKDYCAARTSNLVEPGNLPQRTQRAQRKGRQRNESRRNFHCMYASAIHRASSIHAPGRAFRPAL